MPSNINPFQSIFGGGARFHIEESTITQVNGTLDDRLIINECIVEKVGNIHDIRFKEDILEHATIDRRTRGSKRRDSSKEPPETSDSEGSESTADESEDEGGGPPRVPSETVTRAHTQYQQPALPFAPSQKYQSPQAILEANLVAMVNASAANDMQEQRQQRALNNGALPLNGLLPLGPSGLIPNMMMPGMPGIGGPVGIPGYAYTQMPYHPGMTTRNTSMSTSYDVQNPHATTTKTTTTSISGSGMSLPIVGRGTFEVRGVPSLKGHVSERRRIETTEARGSGCVSNATYTTT